MNRAVHPPDLDEALRQVLRPEPASAELRAKLLARAARKTRPWAPLRAGLLAAAALLVIGLGSMAVPRWKHHASPISLERAFTEASTAFADTRDLYFKEDGCAGKGCGDWAQIRAGFRAPLPACVAEMELHGGGACRIAGHPAVHYLLRDGRMVYVFGNELEACKAGRRIVMERNAIQAQAWNEQKRGYLLLARK